jgi:hypothetical protein
MRKANDRCANVCQLTAPVAMPFTGSTATQPMIPPRSAIHSDAATNDGMRLPRTQDGNVARVFGDGEYMVLSVA